MNNDVDLTLSTAQHQMGIVTLISRAGNPKPKKKKKNYNDDPWTHRKATEQGALPSTWCCVGSSRCATWVDFVFDFDFNLIRFMR